MLLHFFQNENFNIIKSFQGFLMLSRNILLKCWTDCTSKNESEQTQKLTDSSVGSGVTNRRGGEVT